MANLTLTFENGKLKKSGAFYAYSKDPEESNFFKEYGITQFIKGDPNRIYSIYIPELLMSVEYKKIITDGTEKKRKRVSSVFGTSYKTIVSNANYVIHDYGTQSPNHHSKRTTITSLLSIEELKKVLPKSINEKAKNFEKIFEISKQSYPSISDINKDLNKVGLTLSKEFKNTENFQFIQTGTPSNLNNSMYLDYLEFDVKSGEPKMKLYFPKKESNELLKKFKKSNIGELKFNNPIELRQALDKAGLTEILISEYYIYFFKKIYIDIFTNYALVDIHMAPPHERNCYDTNCCSYHINL